MRFKVTKREKKRIEVFFEFLVFGVIMGTIEDALAVTFVTGQPITLDTLPVILAIAIPFAAIGELLVDRYRLFETGEPPKKAKK